MSSLLDPPKCLHDSAGNPTDLVTPGVVRNLLKTNFFLRIPQIREQDLVSKTITLPPGVDVQLEYRQFCSVEKELEDLNRRNIIRIIEYPVFPPAYIASALSVDIENNTVLVVSDVKTINFGNGITVTDDGSKHVTVTADVGLSGNTPQPVGPSGTAGVAVTASPSDHVHEGVHQIKNGAGGTPRTGDMILEAGSNIMISEPVPNTFKFDVAVAVTTEFQVSAGAGLSANVTGGHATFNGVPYAIGSSVVVLPASSTREVYVDINGVVTSGALVPPNAMWLATVTTDGSSVTSVTERRVFVNQNAIWGVAGELLTINAGDLADAGAEEKYARIDHQHPVATDTATGLDANSVNSEGVSDKLARADHTHEILTGVPVTQAPDQANAEGTSNAIARADHVHNIPAAAPVTIGFSNQEGSSSSFARADHVHALYQTVTSFAGLPGAPVNGQAVFANYGDYFGVYIYDASRSAWLSQELLTHAWNSNTNNNTTNVNLISHDDNTQQDNDYPNPFAITIVGLMGTQANTIVAGNETRWEIATFDLATATTTQNVASVSTNVVGDRYAKSLSLNVAVPSLTVLSARRVKVVGGDPITRPALTMFYRIRLS